MIIKGHKTSFAILFYSKVFFCSEVVIKFLKTCQDSVKIIISRFPRKTMWMARWEPEPGMITFGIYTQTTGW